LSSVANRYPERVAGLIYLDAAYPYAFDNGNGPSFKEFQIQGPEPPPPNGADLTSFSALQTYLDRVNGFHFPEGELRQQWESAPDGRVLKQRHFPGSAMLPMGMKKYTNIPVPALVIFANPHTLRAWVENNKDPDIRQAAKAYSAVLGALVTKQENAIKNGVPMARMVTLPDADHYVYLSNQADVLRGTHAFLAGLH